MDDSDAASLYKAQRGAGTDDAAPSATRAAAASHGTRRYNAALKQEEAVIEAAIAA